MNKGPETRVEPGRRRKALEFKDCVENNRRCYSRKEKMLHYGQGSGLLKWKKSPGGWESQAGEGGKRVAKTKYL